jgi:hypothetical protein
MSIYSLILLIAPPTVGVIVGYASGGRIAGLRSIRLSAVWLLWLAAVVQAAQYHVAALRHPGTLVVVFGLVLWWLAMNLPRWPLAIRVAGVAITVGALTNGVTVALNGRMPYQPSGAEAVGLRPALTTPKNEPADEATRLAFLGDTIPVTPLKKLVSPGDVLIGAGIVALTALAMRRRHDQPDPVPQHITGGET